MKRSDLTTTEVLVAVHTHQFRAFEHLTETYPSKVVCAAFERDIRSDLLECGVSLVRPWLAPAGEQQVRAEGRR
ncbi:hypothetical protein [Streptomyces enissocaesilis]|uniref:Uncharacterized protein n=1 Tax=Streptomyces enissocaesilis TaxID=332589 RepID=A0ABN3WW44_9ACTN